MSLVRLTVSSISPEQVYTPSGLSSHAALTPLVVRISPTPPKTAAVAIPVHCAKQLGLVGTMEIVIAVGAKTVVVDEDVPHDGVQPSFDVCPFLEVVLVPKRLDKRFLDQVVGVVAVRRRSRRRRVTKQQEK